MLPNPHEVKVLSLEPFQPCQFVMQKSDPGPRDRLGAVLGAEARPDRNTGGTGEGGWGEYNVISSLQASLGRELTQRRFSSAQIGSFLIQKSDPASQRNEKSHVATKWPFSLAGPCRVVAALA